MRCPGQDQRYWTPKDIATVRCPACGRSIEIWKDEPMRICPGCGAKVRNPNPRMPDYRPLPPTTEEYEKQNGKPPAHEGKEGEA